jgi:hypothetical protein
VKEAGEGRKPKPKVKPPEGPEETDLEKDSSPDVVDEKEPEKEKQGEAVKRNHRDQGKTDVRFVKKLDDDYSDEEPTPIPFVKLRDIDGNSKKGERKWLKKRKDPDKEQHEKAYRLVSRFDDPKIVEHMIEKVSKTELEGVTIGKMVSMSPDFAKGMRKALAKKRKPVRQNLMVGATSDSSAFPYMEDIVSLDRDAINIDDLPQVDSLYIATYEDEGTIPGSIICPDPVLQYLSTLENGEQPRQLFAGTDSAPLRVVFPIVGGKERVEAVIDGGSQIVSMALSTAERMLISWDPDVKIVMQSANGQLKSTAGLARNVPFEFGEITVYLQVHIIDQPAYEVLLGRPFEILTQSTMTNRKDGGQTMTLTDPNSDRKCTIPTHVRGMYSVNGQPKKGVTIEEILDEDDPDYIEESDDSDSEGSGSEEADFQRSSMN